MTTNINNHATALMRDAMDKALSAPNGVRLTFSDEKYGGDGPAKAEANVWAKRLYTARADIRRMIARSEVANMSADEKAAATQAPPEAYLTPYEALYTTIVRCPPDKPAGYWLVIMRADASELGLEIF